ncbi:Aldo/keto reductase [Quadrisphaera granulorum]|uniref:Diketogulonate reductase-like aldo/keto reductase n=1 Tax=Quadrisphaera granulorum TaxID=317664 RepID=A0A315ZVD9_9ACTN|nr:aldo/keto reductase [Quadrisphaera granulorum]PWJ49581.1 diketogulonate reductase-like aldo/keto reductase [Quadrisphaera granulorum]SZE98160.1 Aldo/keto reductase [Quadrisphaera granulorum]
MPLEYGTTVPFVTLNDGVQIPQVGLGVFQVAPEKTDETVLEALAAGYRHIDTAAGYRNEAGVGDALRTAQSSLGLTHDDVFVTTKLANADRAGGRDAALRAFDDSLSKLQLERLDLWLIHWPGPHQATFVEVWKTFAELKEAGRIRSIGVSNFQKTHLRVLFDETGVVPSVNQVELHPWLQQEDLRAFHAEHGIATEAWSPIGQGKGVLEDETIGKIAAAHGKEPAQVVLRWHLQLGNILIPKSVTPSRIRSNIDLFGFELTADDMAAIAGLERGQRLGPDPDVFG